MLNLGMNSLVNLSLLSCSHAHMVHMLQCWALTTFSHECRLMTETSYRALDIALYNMMEDSGGEPMHASRHACMDQSSYGFIPHPTCMLVCPGMGCLTTPHYTSALQRTERSTCTSPLTLLRGLRMRRNRRNQHTVSGGVVWRLLIALGKPKL